MPGTVYLMEKSDSMTLKQHGFVGRIPVRNLWLLMFYASELFRYADNISVTAEEAPDELPDLLAELMTHLLEQRLRRNPSSGYRIRCDDLNRVRGRIDMLRTERRQLLQLAKVACRFEELTVNTPRNRYMKAALIRLAQSVSRNELSRRCLSLATTMTHAGVNGVKPDERELLTEQFSRHDAEDRQLLALARLVFDMAIPTEEIGLKPLFAPDREEHWLRKLFEKAVLGFYACTLSPQGWHVRGGRPLQWPIERQSPGMSTVLPIMKTDIILENTDKRIVIDTKFTSIFAQTQYRQEKLKSGYLYQLYAYLRSQEHDTDAKSRNAIGVLLHPAIGENDAKIVDEWAVIQGHHIRCVAVGLTADSKLIRKQLMKIAQTPDQ